jgi:hypothetical protein
MNEIIQLNKVVLNEKAMNLLESCQKDDNYLLNFSVNNLKDTVCLISRNIDAFNEDDCKEASDLMQGLSILAGEITKLKTS